MRIFSGNRLMAVVERAWQPIRGRRLRVVRAVASGKPIWALADRAMLPDLIVTLERVGPFWFVAGVVK